MPKSSMDEIIPGLWLGNWRSSRDVETLKLKNVMSILSMVRGELPVQEGFIRCQIPVDDDPWEDILTHLPAAVKFIEDQLDKGRGVLVHCMGGISRSPTAVAAYLMHSQDMNVEESLNFIRSKRIHIDPNDGFREQLNVYYNANFTVTQDSKDVRMFYMERTRKGVMYGHAPQPEVVMFANAPSESTNSRLAPILRRKIRCKMCRQELAAREHMLDHGQLGPPVPESSTTTSSLEVLSSHPAPTSKDNESTTIPEVATEPEQNDTARENNEPSQSLNSRITVNGNDNNGETTQSPSKNVRFETPASSQTRHYATSASLNAGIMANPQLAALRGGLPIPSAAQNTPRDPTPPSPHIPVLTNPSCSGYFLEPMKWMEPFLSEGQLGGKIPCPNTKCSAKLGNYDWAGLHCGCDKWVIPGFCINRSKVDEVIG
ncbi:phosphatases II [Pluteus cervinus]|uniref:Phosphatases II n=1 Tax=Pluteus cervinus TaxID=181527 RepID=A0ACD3B331_9AGAR|nr:phosphatases II [Pluteus cervinus]